MVEYIFFVVILEVKETLSTLQSTANLVRVLPISVILSTWTRLAKVTQTALGAGPQGLQEPHQAAAHHGLGVTATRDGFNQIVMSSPKKFKYIPDSDIPRREDPCDLTGVQVPETATIEGCDINVKKFHHDLWINIVELLQ